MSRSAPLFVVALCLTACAQGAPDRRSDAAPPDTSVLEDAMGDTAAPDASMDAAPDAIPDADATPDAPVACTAATADAVCDGWPCVDGYCCDDPCTTACQSCGIAGSEGVCTDYGSGTDPDDECEAEATHTCGTSGQCDGAGACAFFGPEVSCNDGESCTTADACDRAGSCTGDAPPECGPGAGNECCVGTCTDGAGCATVTGGCADTCGSTELSIGQACGGCGAPGAVGVCLGGGAHLCDESSHNLCQTLECGGVSYFCTSTGGVWGWRPNAACDDGDACTHTDVCGAGSCGGAAVDCSDTTCMERECNGTATCTTTPNPGLACDDGDACTYDDICDASGACTAGSSITCTDAPCVDRECNGTFTCTEMILTGSTCDDGDPCTTGMTCTSAGACMGGTTLSCDAMDTTCLDYSCDGSPTCASTPINLGGVCDDGDPASDGDVCRADGSCSGATCPATLTTAFSDSFGSPSSTSWTSGTDATVNTSRWSATTLTNHGVRITGGRLEITNSRSGSHSHGHGYAMVRTGGAGSVYDNTVYDATLKNNAGSEVVWTFNMRRNNPDPTSGGFDCSSTSSQNGRTVGLAYVLASSTASGLNASTSTCSPSGSAFGYAVLMGGSSGAIRLVRFENGLRNGVFTGIVSSGGFSVSSYFSVRVTYDSATDRWRLEARSDGSSSFSDPASGSYGFNGTGTDAAYVSMPLEYSGPYFQSGCTGLCSETYTTRFDNVNVGVRCAP